MAVRRVPLRTCVGCRRRAPSTQLLRVVAIGADLLPDPARRLPGRGAYVHLDPTCLALAERRRAFGRALRVAGVLDTGLLAEHLRAVTVRPEVTDGGASAPPGSAR